jgi:RNase P/RNase MRP subunit p29
MIEFRLSTIVTRGLLVGGALCITFFSPAAAQVQTNTSVAHGQATHEVTIERGEIVYVSGNDVVIKMEDGSLRDFYNVPDSTTVTVDGKQLNVHQIKPGMKVEKQTITTTTPRVITKVETVTGKVWHVSPPNSVILTLEDGTNQSFKIPTGQKFTINGKETDAFGLRKGMVVSAQRVTEVPETVVTQQVKRTGTMPPSPVAPKQDVPVLIVAAPPKPAPAETAAAEPAPAKLPKTASDLPLVALLGVVLCGMSLLSTAVRKLVRG